MKERTISLASKIQKKFQGPIHYEVCKACFYCFYRNQFKEDKIIVDKPFTLESNETTYATNLLIDFEINDSLFILIHGYGSLKSRKDVILEFKSILNSNQYKYGVFIDFTGDILEKGNFIFYKNDLEN